MSWPRAVSFSSGIGYAPHSRIIWSGAKRLGMTTRLSAGNVDFGSFPCIINTQWKTGNGYWQKLGLVSDTVCSCVPHITHLSQPLRVNRRGYTHRSRSDMEGIFKRDFGTMPTAVGFREPDTTLPVWPIRILLRRSTVRFQNPGLLQTRIDRINALQLDVELPVITEVVQIGHRRAGL